MKTHPPEHYSFGTILFATLIVAYLITLVLSLLFKEGILTHAEMGCAGVVFISAWMAFCYRLTVLSEQFRKNQEGR